MTWRDKRGIVWNVGWIPAGTVGELIGTICPLGFAWKHK